MKKYSLVAALLLFYLTICKSANAQYAQNEKGVYRFSIILAGSYTPDTLVAKPSGEGGLYFNSINIKALRNFKKQHAAIENASWTTLEDGGFRAKFSSNGTGITEYYHKNGNWANSLKEYTEEWLPVAVRDLVKRENYDYTITKIYEIETAKSRGLLTYIIRMENKRSFKFIRVQDGEMSIWKELDKQE